MRGTDSKLYVGRSRDPLTPDRKPVRPLRHWLRPFNHRK